jgi:glycosyltransferase involved in cell wall biosynthesis
MSGVSTTISAVMPLGNGRSSIERSLGSILRQSLMPIEIILIDDASTNDGAAIVDQLASNCPVSLLRQEREGTPASARNLGASRSKGDLIAFLDQGDVWYPNHLEELTRPFLQSDSEQIGWAYSDADQIDDSGKIVTRNAVSAEETPHPKRSLVECLQPDQLVLLSASLVSRKAFDAVGGFDERLSAYEDEDLFLRVFRDGFENVFVDQALGQWRKPRIDSAAAQRKAYSAQIYARKLITLLADDQTTEQPSIRNLIAQRFHDDVVEGYRQALASNDPEAIRAARDSLQFIRSHLPATVACEAKATSLTISAIIPLYNGAKYIEEAVRSVAQQTLPPAEIIVVNDGSTDNGAEVVEGLKSKYPVRLLNMANGGQSSARNHGVAHSGGDLIALLDQDDAWYPEHLETLIKPFLEPGSERLGWVYSNLDEMDEQGLIVTNSFLSTIPTQHPKRDIMSCLRADMFILPSASLITRKAFDQVGGFDVRLSGYEDDDLFLRLFQAGFDNHYIDEPLSKWRIYPSSSSYSFRMAKSRSIYARKLLKQFPDDPARARFYSRDLLGPRFLAHMLHEYRKAAATGEPALISATIDDLRFIRPYLRPRLQTALSVLLGLGPRAEYLLRAQSALRPIYRRLLT